MASFCITTYYDLWKWLLELKSEFLSKLSEADKSGVFEEGKKAQIEQERKILENSFPSFNSTQIEKNRTTPEFPLTLSTNCLFGKELLIQRNKKI